LRHDEVLKKNETKNSITYKFFSKELSMKRFSFTLVFLMVICVFSFSQASEQVYFAGEDEDDTVYWLNGQKHVLPKTGDKRAGVIAITH
jgi:hypothetical protein